MDGTPLLIQNDKKAFEHLFRSYYEPLVLFAVRYVVSKEQAEELVQETFFKIWEKSADISIRTTVKSYLYGAVRNACLNHLKHLKVRDQYAVEHPGAHNTLPLDLIEMDELKNSIEEALDQLPEKCREVFELSRFQEKSYKEIAEELNISVKTVENQMGKALRVMRDQLGHLLGATVLIDLQLILSYIE